MVAGSASWGDVRQQFQGLKKKQGSGADAAPAQEAGASKAGARHQGKPKPKASDKNASQVDKLLGKQAKEAGGKDKKQQGGKPQKQHKQ